MVEKKLMVIDLRFDTNGVDWQEACIVFERAPLGERKPDILQATFEDSDLVCFAWDGDTLIGFARALSDWHHQSIIYDLCMLPEYQGAGLGSRIMREMMERLNTPNHVLWAAIGKEGFYKKLGFAPMLTAMAKFDNPQDKAANGYIKLD